MLNFNKSEHPFLVFSPSNPPVPENSRALWDSSVTSWKTNRFSFVVFKVVIVSKDLSSASWAIKFRTCPMHGIHWRPSWATILGMTAVVSVVNVWIWRSLIGRFNSRHQNPIFFKRLSDWNFEVVRGLFIFGKALQEQSMPDPLLVEKMEDDSKIWIPSSRGPTIRRKTTWKKITMELQFQSPCEEFNFCRQNAFHCFNTWRIISRMKGSHKLLELFAVNKGKRQMSLSHPMEEFFVYFLSMISRDQIFIEFSNFRWSLNNCPRDENTMFFLQVAFWEIQFPCWWNALLVVFVKEEFLSHQLANMASRRLSLDLQGVAKNSPTQLKFFFPVFWVSLVQWFDEGPL